MEETRVYKPNTGVQRFPPQLCKWSCDNDASAVELSHFSIVPVSTLCRAHKYSPARLGERALRLADATKFLFPFLSRLCSHLSASSLLVISTFLFKVAVTDIVSYVSSQGRHCEVRTPLESHLDRLVHIPYNKQ